MSEENLKFIGLFGVPIYVLFKLMYRRSFVNGAPNRERDALLDTLLPKGACVKTKKGCTVPLIECYSS